MRMDVLAVVKAVNVARGFGFLRVRGEVVEPFFHHSNLSRDLLFDERLRGRRVLADLEQGPRGLCAVNVRPANDGRERGERKCQ